MDSSTDWMFRPAERLAFREDPSTDWMFSDSGMLTNGKIPPLTGGIRTLENLADSTDAEYEEDRPEKQFLRKLQWMWE